MSCKFKKIGKCKNKLRLVGAKSSTLSISSALNSDRNLSESDLKISLSGSLQINFSEYDFVIFKVLPTATCMKSGGLRVTNHQVKMKFKRITELKI